MRCSRSLVIREIYHFTFISDQQKLENWHSCYYHCITNQHKTQLLKTTTTILLFFMVFVGQGFRNNLAERLWPRVKGVWSWRNQEMRDISLSLYGLLLVVHNMGYFGIPQSMASGKSGFVHGKLKDSWQVFYQAREKLNRLS